LSFISGDPRYSPKPKSSHKASQNYQSMPKHVFSQAELDMPGPSIKNVPGSLDSRGSGHGDKFRKGFLLEHEL